MLSNFTVKSRLIGMAAVPLVLLIVVSLVIAYVTLKGRPEKFVMIKKNHNITGV